MEMRTLLTTSLVALIFSFLINSCAKNTNKGSIGEFPSYNPNYPPPPGSAAFELRQDYPRSLSLNTIYPWQSIDFKQNPTEYMKVVLNYCLEGNIEVDFKIQENRKRSWYHAPWLHDDDRTAGNGREYVHGLTRELQTAKFGIHKFQDVELENWAIGFYNEPGGYTLGKVWLSDSVPSPSLSTFPEGTVSFKLLFTDGSVEKIPFLKGTKEWEANIYPCNPRKIPNDCADATNRINRTVRLLQIDIAVKDKRSHDTGWVFGTFIYDASEKGSTVWEKMVPVGLSWADDSKIKDLINKEGSFVNPKLKESYINSALIERTNSVYTNEAYLRHHGLGGRLNGPIDNQISSCISCHARSAITKHGKPLRTGNFELTRATYDTASFSKFFSTIAGGAHQIDVDRETYITTDYSLQLAAGIRNFYQKRNKITVKAFDGTNLTEVTRGN